MSKDKDCCFSRVPGRLTSFPSSPPCVRFCLLVSAMRRLFVRSLFGLCSQKSGVLPFCLKRKQAAHDKPWPCRWTLSALCLLWGRAGAPSSKILAHRSATHSIYIACPLVNFLGIHFDSPNAAFASAPYVEKTVWGLCWYIALSLGCYVVCFFFAYISRWFPFYRQPEPR